VSDDISNWWKDLAKELQFDIESISDKNWISKLSIK
jgi:hypothetical protein